MSWSGRLRPGAKLHFPSLCPPLGDLVQAAPLPFRLALYVAGVEPGAAVLLLSTSDSAGLGLRATGAKGESGWGVKREELR